MANPRCRPSYTIALFWAALFMLAVSNIAHASTCIGINGEPVDFFVMYKLPGNCVSNPWQRGNVSLYMDNSTLHSDTPWIPASVDAENPLNALLSQLTTDNTSYVMYNDQPPWFDGIVKPSYTMFLAYAHAKGLVHWNDTQGFWLQHSVPSWPNITSAQGWTTMPTPQTCNGQHLLCMSIGTNTINSAVADILETTRPTVYESRIADSNGNMAKWINSWRKTSIAPKPTPLTRLVTNAGALMFDVFAKTNAVDNSTALVESAAASEMCVDASIFIPAFFCTRATHRDPTVSDNTFSVIDGLTVPDLARSFAWQTWRTGSFANATNNCTYDPSPPNMPSNCSIAPHVIGLWAQGAGVPPTRLTSANVMMLKSPLPNLNAPSGRTWMSCTDHSKWGVTTDPLTWGTWTCLGDMNRETSQWTRGGAFWCTQHPAIHHGLTQFVDGVQGCSS